MANVWKTALLAAVLGVSGLTQANGMTEERWGDDFNDNIQDASKWGRWEITAKLAETGGKLLFSRKADNPSVFQYAYLYGTGFERDYNAEDYLLTMATVHAPHKIKTPGKRYRVGIAVAVNDSWFVDLMVEDTFSGRQFVVVYHDPQGHRITLFYAAPQDISSYSLKIVYDAKTDRFRCYWSRPGSLKSALLGGPIQTLQSPRTLMPVAQGYMYKGAAVPAAWDISIDDFSAYRKNAP